jgi:murein DD-endopeptidase MepM/ murein hydrolase activator NlpD
MKIKKIGVYCLIFLFKLLAATKKIFVALFYVTFRPFRAFLRFIFYKILVKAYCFYISFLKKVGWYKFKGGLISFLVNHRTVHFVMGGLTLIFVFTNLTVTTQTVSASERARKTMISKLITSEFGGYEQGGELIEETVVDSSVNYNVNSKYLDDKTALGGRGGIGADPAPQADTNGFMGSVIPEPGVIAGSDTDEPGPGARQQPQREEVVVYTVKPGDTISTIASNFGVSVNTILWENDLSSYSLIRPGDDLRILPVTGVAHKVSSGETLGYISNRYDVSEEEIMETNDIKQANALQIGQELLIPGGEKITTSNNNTRVASRNDTTQEKGSSGISVIKEIVKPDNKKQVASNKMAWPTQGHRITQYYSWRHHGLDIANKTGTPLYSSDAGRVQYAGWSNGYGNNVIIDHGGGKQTRYAHLSKFYCNTGDSVAKGETIGAMGNTGWSTGPHLHFEVIINGTKYNPLNYIR